MLMRRDLSMSVLGLMFDRSRHAIGKYILEWMPKWGSAGQDLSILGFDEAVKAVSEPDMIPDKIISKITNKSINKSENSI